MKHDIENKLKELVYHPELIKVLGDLIIVKDEQGFELFNSYRVDKISTGWRVKSLTTNLENTFYILKSAATYCVFHHANQLSDAEMVRTLDAKLGGAESNLLILRCLIRKKLEKNQNSIYSAKLQEQELIIKAITPKLEQLWCKSRDHQIKKFNARKINTTSTWERS